MLFPPVVIALRISVPQGTAQMAPNHLKIVHRYFVFVLFSYRVAYHCPLGNGCLWGQRYISYMLLIFPALYEIHIIFSLNALSTKRKETKKQEVLLLFYNKDIR